MLVLNLQLVAEVKAMTKERQPQFFCFTSCIISDTCKLNEIENQLYFLEEFYGGKLLPTYDQSATQR